MVERHFEEPCIKRKNFFVLCGYLYDRRKNLMLCVDCFFMDLAFCCVDIKYIASDFATLVT
jgi:hypothetical protein